MSPSAVDTDLPVTQPARHAEPIAAMLTFFERVRAQEERYVDAGFDASGVTDALVRWWDSWTSMSMEKVREAVSDDLVTSEPMTGNRPIRWGQAEVDFWSVLLKTVHRGAYYRPLADDREALPMWDFADGEIRMTLPYRIVGRIPPRRLVEVEAVDRYRFVRDPDRGWLLARIDTNGDSVALVMGLLGLPLPPSPQSIRRLLTTAQRFFPGLRGPQVRPFATATEEV